MKKKIAVMEEKNLILREITKEDIEQIRLWRNREEVRTRFIHDDLITESQQETWYRSYQNKDNDIMWMAIEKSNKKPVGTVSLYDIDRVGKTAEVGRVIVAPEHRRKGLGKRLMESALDYAFIEIGLHMVCLSVFYDNIVPMKIYLDLGFIPYDAVAHKGRYLIFLRKTNPESR